jgi:hypothetical protein
MTPTPYAVPTGSIRSERRPAGDPVQAVIADDDADAVAALVAA